MSSPSGFTHPQRTLWVVLILAALTFLIFGQTLRFGFVAFDDAQYVAGNPELARGLTWEGVRWAFTVNFFQFSDRVEYWQPLTQLTRLADYQFYGFAPWGHHLTSVCIHLGAGLVLFGALRTLTGAFWRSALVAALFLVHPMHVEPVVWLSARKDLVSGFFYLLAVWVYGIYGKKPGVGRYAWLCGAVLAANMAKPMAVSLPVVFLLLDGWPLGRWRWDMAGRGRVALRLIGEKMPFFVLAVLVSVLAVLGQQHIGALGGNDDLPLPWRLGNVALAVAVYVIKVLLPFDLALYYPHPGRSLAVFWTVLAGLVLGFVTFWALRQAKRWPAVAMGWCWFLVVLAPVSGLMQIGDQGMADRYSYLSFIGLFIAAVWGVTAWMERCPDRVPLRTRSVAAVAWVLVLSGGAFMQTSLWRDDVTLFSHALEVTRDNYVMEFNLGSVLWNQGKREEALPHLTRVQTLRGPVMERQLIQAKDAEGRGDDRTAIACLRRVLTFKPWDAELRFRLGQALARDGQTGKALGQFNEALRYQRNWNAPRWAIIGVLHGQGQDERARMVLEQALLIEPAAPEGARWREIIPAR